MRRTYASHLRAWETWCRGADLGFGPHGLSVLLPRSKADQTGAGVMVHVAANPLTAHCPVAALRSWLEAAGSGTADQPQRRGRPASPVTWPSI